MSAPPQYRVKVYKLNPDDNQWNDNGTGHARLDYIEKFGTIGIIVVSEDDGSTILQTKVCPEDIYQQQQETLIVWNEPESEEDLALSFVDKKSCLVLWNQLCKTQQRLKTAEKELPVPNIANLPEIDRLINDANVSNKESLGITIFSEENFVDALFELGETTENQEDLERLYSIFKGMVLLNEPNLLEVLLSDEHILRLFDILKNDPKIPFSKRVNHKEFLTKVSVFKEVVPIRDSEIISKIHQTFRIKYLRDSVLLSVLDDVTCSTLNTMIYYNNVEILSVLQTNQTFLNDLFSSLLNTENSTQQKIDLITFLQHFCELSKNFQEEARINFFKTLQVMGLFNLFEIYLNEDNLTITLACLDILNSTIIHLPSDMREFYIAESQQPSYPSFRALVNCLLRSNDPSVMGQIAEMIRRLVDIDVGNVSSNYLTRFLGVFYSHFIELLYKPLSSDYHTQHSQIHHYNLINHILDIFTFCVPKHGYRIREFILKSDLIEQSLKYLNSTGFLIISVLKLFRSIVSQRNRNYEKLMISKNLFDPILQIFRSNNNRNNMINSSILELFSMIDQECYNDHKLIAFLVEKYREDFEAITYVNTFRNLINKYESHKELLNSSPPDSSVKKRTHDQAFENEDDSYFDQSDDEYHVSTPPTDAGDDQDEESIGSNLPPLQPKSYEEEEQIVVKKKHPIQISFKTKNNHSNNSEKSETPETPNIIQSNGDHQDPLPDDSGDAHHTSEEEADGAITQKLKRQKLPNTEMNE